MVYASGVIKLKRKSLENSSLPLSVNIVDDRIIFMLTAHRSQQICPGALQSVCTCGLIELFDRFVSKTRHDPGIHGLCFGVGRIFLRERCVSVKC